MAIVGVICEAPADLATAKALFQRVLFDAASWIDADTFKSVCQFAGVVENTGHALWTDLGKIDRPWPRYRAQGKFSGAPGEPMANAARTALFHFMHSGHAEAVLLMKDGDDQADDRRRGLMQARDDAQWPFPVLFCVPVPERESWHLSGFIATDEDEQSRLAAARARLAFDPTLEPERLTSKNPTDARDCKRALDELTRGDRSRELDCLLSPPVDHLKARGHANGLCDFLDQIAEHLAPLITGQPPPSR
jgi:hypothetical protein